MLPNTCWSIVFGFLNYKEKCRNNVVCYTWKVTKANWETLLTNSKNLSLVLNNSHKNVVTTCNVNARNSNQVKLLYSLNNLQHLDLSGSKVFDDDGFIALHPLTQTLQSLNLGYCIN